MNFTEIEAEVTAWTKRPDLAVQARSAIRTATLFAHRSDNYWRDLVDGTLVPISAAEGVISLEDYMPRFRELASLRPISADGTQWRELEQRDIDDLMDDYRSPRKHWFCGISSGIRYNTELLTPNLRVAYYVDPDVNPTTYNSWIAVKYPDVIIKWATALMFRTMGNTEESRAELESAQALLQTLVQHDFNIKGR